MIVCQRWRSWSASFCGPLVAARVAERKKDLRTDAVLLVAEERAAA